MRTGHKVAKRTHGTQCEEQSTALSYCHTLCVLWLYFPHVTKSKGEDERIVGGPAPVFCFLDKRIEKGRRKMCETT
jgi:hypothetical protein